MSDQHLSGYGLRRALIAGIQRVIAQRDEINRINVFPVADGDTGTNMASTLSAVLQGMREPRLACAGEVMQRVASEAIDSARGNSGAILAQFFQGAAEALAACPRLTPAALAEAASRGSSLARTAMAEPCEGTILTVIQTFANEMRIQAEAGARDFRGCFDRALECSREALLRTRLQLPALRSAGVVDAGAQGFVNLLEGISEYLERGSVVLSGVIPEEFSAAGVDTAPGSAGPGGCRHCTECTVSAENVNRTALKADLLALPLSSLVITGTRDKVRLHAHLDNPLLLFEAAARFGTVSRERVDDLRLPAQPANPRRQPVVIVTDSGGDIPAEAMDRLNIHLVPVRLMIAGRDYIDRVSISTHEFYHAMRTNPTPPRTSQPPPGDFRRMFDYLLSHHERVIEVSLARALSGTLQSAERAAARTDSGRVTVFDTCSVSAGQGLLAIWAAEAAQAGLNAPRILDGLARMRSRTMVYAVVRDIQYAVRGGRAPRLALTLTRLLRFSLTLKIRPNGRLGLMGGLWGGKLLPARFARQVVRQLDPTRRYRVIVGHCDCAGDAGRVYDTLLASGRVIDRVWVVEIGVGIGAHAGPGSLVIGVQDYEPPSP